MNKKEIYQEMIAGHIVRAEHFRPEEYLMYNPSKDRIETEEGYPMDNFWDKDYQAGVNWQVVNN